MVVGRLAPSPTGKLHLGHARSFLLAWWSARAQFGKVRLRLEDLDGERARPEYVDACKRDLEWLGLDWDGEPRVQSTGLANIVAAARALERRGLAYPCVCTRGDLRAAASAPQAGTTELRYPGTCRDRDWSAHGLQDAPRSSAALRFRVDAGKVTVLDAFAGAKDFDVAQEVGDFVILRRDEIPSYQLAVVVDDAEDEVTEVVRGDDLLPSAARQLLLERALGLETKRYVHVPLVTDCAGRRLAKRADDLGLSTLREAGVDPRAIVGWVARASGFGTVERAWPGELVGAFTWANVPKEPVPVHPDLVDALFHAR